MVESGQGPLLQGAFQRGSVQILCRTVFDLNVPISCLVRRSQDKIWREESEGLSDAKCPLCQQCPKGSAMSGNVQLGAEIGGPWRRLLVGVAALPASDPACETARPWLPTAPAQPSSITARGPPNRCARAGETESLPAGCVRDTA